MRDRPMGIITDGPVNYCVVRHDGKEINLRNNRQTAKFDAEYRFHQCNDHHIEEVSAAAILWWNPVTKGREWVPWGSEHWEN